MRIMIWTLCAMSAICCASAVCAQTPYYGNLTVSVAVDQSWTDTGLDLGAGDRVIVTASGAAAASAVVQGVPQWFGPDGIGDNCQDPNKPYPCATNMLVGKIGESGAGFAVGSFRGFSADAPGRLYLGVNDGFPEDGSGCFVAVIYLLSCEISAVSPGDIGGTLGLQSYPNPLALSATVSFALASSGFVNLRVYDPSGRGVRTMSVGRLDRGSHRVMWDARDDSGMDVAPGVYFYELRVDGQRQGVLKTIVLK